MYSSVPAGSAPGRGPLGGGARDQGVSLRARVWHVQGGASTGHRSVHRQDSCLECPEHAGLVNEHPDSVTYDDQFSYAAHEVGYMLGNPDEYEGGESEGTAEHEKLVEASGAGEVIRDADTSSVMSKGGDVLPAHLATAWEALGRVTAKYLAPSDWKF